MPWLYFSPVSIGEAAAHTAVKQACEVQLVVWLITFTVTCSKRCGETWTNFSSSPRK